MYSRDSLVPFTIWEHKTKGGRYIILGIAMCCTNGSRDKVEESVIYYSVDYHGLRYREINEFCDGRFVPIYALPEKQL